MANQDWSIHITNFRKHLMKSGHSPSTQECYSRDVLHFLEFLHQSKISPQNTAPETLIFFQDMLKEGQQSPNSIRRKLISIRQFFRFLADHKLITTNPLDDSVLPKRQDLATSTTELHSIIPFLQAVAPQRFKEARDSLALSLLALEGLKVSELIHLNWHDVLANDEHSTVMIQGQRQRLLQLCETSNRLLMIYQEFWNSWQAHHPKVCKSLLVGFKGRDASIVLESVTRHGIKFMLYELGNQLDICHLHAEKLRHHAIDHLISRGLGPDDIRERLGLKRPGTISQHFRFAHLQDKGSHPIE